MPEVYTVKDLSRMLQLHPETVRSYLKTNKIKGMKFGNKWRVTQKGLEYFLKAGDPGEE